jgi:hypothetical protein
MLAPGWNPEHGPIASQGHSLSEDFRKDYISTCREVFYNRLCRGMVKICLAHCILSAEYSLVAQDFRSVPVSIGYPISRNSSTELLYAMVDIVNWTEDGEIRGCSGFTNTWRREI